jgi:hypothetical protein
MMFPPKKTSKPILYRLFKGFSRICCFFPAINPPFFIRPGISQLASRSLGRTSRVDPEVFQVHGQADVLFPAWLINRGFFPQAPVAIGK